MKKTLISLIVIIIIALVGCTQSNNGEIVNPNVEENISEGVGVDPLVEYALKNIDFQFVSDTGYYMDYDSLAEVSYSNATMIKDINNLGILIAEKNFSELRETILDIPDYNNLMREVKVNYIVPILMHENNYKDALRIVYKKEAVEKKENRFLFDIIYLMRYMYVNNGLEYAVEVVDQLKEEYPKENVSYVWFAISPRQYDILNDRGFIYPPEEDSDRNKLWRYLTKHYPDDPHIDYAYYFLGDYEKIIQDYPDSDLMEKATYARANTLYSTILNDIYNDDDKLNREDILRVKDYYKIYLSAYSDSDYSYGAVFDIIALCRTMYFKYGEDKHYFDFIKAIDKMAFDGSYYKKQQIIDRLLYAIKNDFVDSDNLVEMSEDIQAFLNDKKLSSSTKYYIWSGLANNAFYKGELELANTYFKNINRYDLNKFDLFRMVALSELKPLLGKFDANSLFDKAEILRKHGEYFASVYVYDKLIKLSLSNKKLSKAYMLRASSSKKNRVYDEMLESYEYIVKNLASTDFADDALAEIGVHYLLTEEEYDKARAIFRKVIKKYPNTNAVNNAYNWIAWSYLKEKDYHNALRAYEELRDKFPEDRFGKNAIPNIKKIKKILESGEQ